MLFTCIGGEMGIKAMLLRSRSPLFMILVQLFLTGMMLLSKVILNRGIFIFALLTYRQIVATIFLSPLAFILERDMGRKLTKKALLWIFFNGFFGVTMALGLYYYGLRDTSATFSSTFLNLVPIVTFVFSIVAGIENLGLKSIGGRVKIAGAILCVAGAIIISMYRGKPLHIGTSHMHDNHSSMKQKTGHNIAQGSLMLVGSCFSSAAWFIVQVKLFKVFPSMYWATILSCLAGGVQSAIIGIALDRGKAAWRLAWDLNLLTIVYSGVLTTGVNFCLISWTVARRGPTYPAMFNPVCLIFVAILESLFMGEELFVGSILGMILIIGGLYAFLWGKRNQLPAHNANVGDATRKRNQFPAHNANVGDVALVPESTHSRATITPVIVGDITLVLESAQPCSTISPIEDHWDDTIINDTTEKVVGN